jgi:hypothetical protein
MVRKSLERGAGMFGHHNLYRDGVPARSVIISVLEGVEVKDGRVKHEQMVGRWEVVHETADRKVFFDVVARVEFGDGTTAQHADRLWRHDVGACTVGDVLPVRYDRRDREKIVFDLPELEASKYSPKEREDGRAPHQPGYQVAPAHSGDVSGDAIRELLSEIRADPRGFAEHMRQVAQENGTNTFVFTSTTSVSGPAHQPETEVGFPLVDLNDDPEDL